MFNTARLQGQLGQQLLIWFAANLLGERTSFSPATPRRPRYLSKAGLNSVFFSPRLVDLRNLKKPVCITF